MIIHRITIVRWTPFWIASHPKLIFPTDDGGVQEGLIFPRQPLKTRRLLPRNFRTKNELEETGGGSSKKNSYLQTKYHTFARDANVFIIEFTPLPNKDGQDFVTQATRCCQTHSSSSSSPPPPPLHVGGEGGMAGLAEGQSITFWSAVASAQRLDVHGRSEKYTRKKSKQTHGI